MFYRSLSSSIMLKSMIRNTHTLINYKIYPLHDRESTAYNKLITKGRQEYISTGCLYLPNFLATETRTMILDEINSILKDSSQTLYNAYVEHTEDLYSTSSSKTNQNDIYSSSKLIIAFDQIPDESRLRRIYAWKSLMDFITDIVQIHPRLYPSADELGALYVNVYRQANKLNWHTDHSNFFVNLLLQQASVPHEGIFEYKRMKGSSYEIVRRDDFQAGGLVLFNGRSYSHRITEVRQSELPRINAILTYDCHPHHRLSDYVLEKFFGRTTKQQ